MLDLLKKLRTSGRFQPESELSGLIATTKKSRAEKEEIESDIRGQIELVRVEFPRTGYRMLIQHLNRRGIVIGETKLGMLILPIFGLQMGSFILLSFWIYVMRFLKRLMGNWPLMLSISIA
jgi:hypothetical protein